MEHILNDRYSSEELLELIDLYLNGSYWVRDAYDINVYETTSGWDLDDEADIYIFTLSDDENYYLSEEEVSCL